MSITPGGDSFAVDPTSMTNTSTSLLAVAVEIEGNFTKAQKLVEALTPEFQGQAGVAARNFYDELNAQALAFHQAFQEYGQALGIAATTYEDSNRGVAQMFTR